MRRPSSCGKKVHTVTLADRTLYRDGSWNTLCLPFALSAEQVAEQLNPLELKTLCSSDFDNMTSTLTLNFEKAATIEAGKPYIVKWSPGGENIVNPVFTSVTIGSATAAVETTDVDFIGITSPVMLDGTDRTKLYLGGDNTLYYPSTDVTINSCRAYFMLKGDVVAGDLPHNVKAFVLNFGGEETTGIVDVKGNPACREAEIPNALKQGAVWHTLDGRQLDNKPTTKGVYVSNGKKVVVH